MIVADCIPMALTTEIIETTHIEPKTVIEYQKTTVVR
jgi:hypothetical protein